MQRTQFRNVALWLLPLLPALLLSWLALPRLLGLAAEHWLDTPGLEALHIDISQVDSGRVHLHEVHGVYRSAGGHRFQFVLRNLNLHYSLVRRSIERLDIASGELDVYPGQEAKHSPWPQVEIPASPLNEIRVAQLRVALHRSEKRPLEAQGSFRLRKTAGQMQGEFRPGPNLLRVTASDRQLPHRTLEILAEWFPSDELAAEVRLHIGHQPEQEPARLVARLPLHTLMQLGQQIGLAAPLTATRGAATLKAEAFLGENAGTLRGINGDAEIVDAAMQVTGTDHPIGIEVDGRASFCWEPLRARIELLPGLRWQAMAVGKEALRANGSLERSFAVLLDDGEAASMSQFPFTLHSPQWGLWAGTVEQIKANGAPGLGDWHSAEARLRFGGELKQWQRDTVKIDGLQAGGTLTLNWSRSAELFSELAVRLDLQRLAWLGESPLTVGKSIWEVKANSSSRIGGDFWNSLDLSGEARSQRLSVALAGARTLTLGPSRLHLARFRPPGPKGAHGRLSLSADAIRTPSWPAPDVRAQLRLDGSTLHADGTMLLKGTELLRISGMHALSLGCGKATLTASQALQKVDELLQPRPPALHPLVIQKGEANARFNLNWCSRPRWRLNANGTLQVRDAALGWEQARGEAMQVGLQLDGLEPLQGRIQLAALRGELATGTPLADLNADLDLRTDTLNVRALHVNLLGGSLYHAPLSLPWPLGEQPLSLEIRQIDFGQLLALTRVQGLSGSGQLGGVLPIAYRDGSLEIRDGQIESLGSGTIRYAPDQSLPENPGLLALRNFHFQRLSAQVSYSADGTYRTLATLEGNNPDFYGGYPIHFGLNINGKLPGMLRSAVFSGDFSRHILEQLQSGKLE